MDLTGPAGERLLETHEAELRAQRRAAAQQAAKERRISGEAAAEREAQIRRPSRTTKALLESRGHVSDLSGSFREEFDLETTEVDGKEVKGTLILASSKFVTGDKGVLPVDVSVELTTDGPEGGTSEPHYLGTVHEPTIDHDSRRLQEDSLQVHAWADDHGQPALTSRRINLIDGPFLTDRLLEAAAIEGIPLLPTPGPAEPANAV